MRMHTCLHLLCALVKFPVTGGQIGADEGRLDFDIEDASAVDKDKLTADLNALIAADHPVSERWITDAELEANPGLVRTMAVKPPMGSRPRAAGRHRRQRLGRPAALRRHPRQAHRRDRPRRRHQDREEGQAEPAHPRRVRLKGNSDMAIAGATPGNMAGRDRLAGRPARRARTSSSSTAPCTCRPPGATPRPNTSRSTSPARCSSTSTTSPTRIPAAAHAAFHRQVRQPHEEDGHRRRHGHRRLRQRGPLLGGARVVDVPRHGPRATCACSTAA